jgi:predicted nucleic acid-binding protein
LRLYLDSSVLLKLYKQEKDSDLMDKMIQRVDKGD